MSDARKQDCSNCYALFSFSTVTKCGETHWARQRIETLRYLRVTQPDGSETKPYADQERVKMIVVSARTPETRGEFDSTLDAATYEEQLLFAHRAHFSLANDNETAGRGKADTRGAQLLVCANNNERDKKAMIKRVDELLAAPVFVDETKVAEIYRFVQRNMSVCISVHRLRRTGSRREDRQIRDLLKNDVEHVHLRSASPRASRSRLQVHFVRHYHVLPKGVFDPLAFARTDD